jgi:DNA-binding transcriptional LysR family regulator
MRREGRAEKVGSWKVMVGCARYGRAILTNHHFLWADFFHRRCVAAPRGHARAGRGHRLPQPAAGLAHGRRWRGAGGLHQCDNNAVDVCRILSNSERIDPMPDIDDYSLFAAILEHGSLSSAARATERSLQAVSRTLAKLESELGVQLIERTTRRLHATPAGTRFYQRIRNALSDIEAARAEIKLEGETVRGHLRLAAPVLFGAACLTPLVARLMQRWPDITVELSLSDRSGQLNERLDLMLLIGAPPEAGLRSRGLVELRRVFFAAPDFLQRHGRPATLEEMARLPCVLRTAGPERHRWPVLVDGVERRVEVDGPYRANDITACNEAVACGLGIGLAPLWQIRHMLDAGRVEMLLLEYAPAPIPVHALWHNRTLPARTRLFIDFLVLHMASELA